MLPGSCLSDGCFHAEKQQGCERMDFLDAPVLLQRVSAQITPPVQVDPAPTCPHAGEVHIPLPESTAALGWDGCAKLYFSCSLKTQIVSGLGLVRDKRCPRHTPWHRQLLFQG